MELRRALLSAVRRAIWRTAFFADLVLAIIWILEVAFGPQNAARKAKQKHSFDVFYSERPRRRQLDETGGRRPFLEPCALPVLEVGLPLVDEGGHALFLILGGEQRVELAALEAGALGKRRGEAPVAVSYTHLTLP